MTDIVERLRHAQPWMGQLVIDAADEVQRTRDRDHKKEERLESLQRELTAMTRLADKEGYDRVMAQNACATAESYREGWQKRAETAERLVAKLENAIRQEHLRWTSDERIHYPDNEVVASLDSILSILPSRT
jgi:hypothetical protein